MFEKEVFEFSNNLESLRDFIETVDSYLGEKSDEELASDPASFAPMMLLMKKQYPDDISMTDNQEKTLLEDFGSKIEFSETLDDEGDVRYSFTLEPEGQKKFSQAMDKMRKTDKRKKSLHQSSIVTLISYVEWFLAQLLHRHFENNSNSIGLKEKQLSLSDLYEIGDIEDARKYLTDTKVESILRGSFSDWIQYLRDKLNLNMSYINDISPIMIEACQRRNLYVHNGGIVNSIYLKNCKFENDKAPKIGDTIDCNESYIENVISIFETSFLLIAAEFWKKHEPENRKRFLIYNEMAYEHIKEGRYEIGEALSYFLCGDKKQKEADRLSAQINFWQAKKWQEKLEEVEKEIEEMDFSAKGEVYNLAKFSLLDMYNEAFELLPKLHRSGDIETRDILEWPLFSNIREQEAYNDLLEQLGIQTNDDEENSKQPETGNKANQSGTR